MEQQALQILKYLAERGHGRLPASDIRDTLASAGFIAQPDPLIEEWILTRYGKGVLQQIKKAGTDAMLQMIKLYL